MKLQGIFVDAATPFDSAGAIYRVKVRHNIEKWDRTNIAGYLFGGEAGEGPLLRESEKIALWEMAAQWAAPGRTLLAGVTAEGVEESVALAKRAGEIGFHAVVCGAPRHYAPGLDVALLYFRSVADRSPIPVLLHDASEIAVELSAHPNVGGAIQNGVPASRSDPGFSVLAGSATGLWESLQQGASGAVLALASAVPYACITLWEAFRMREEEAGLDWQHRIAHPGKVVTEVPALKHAMELNGYYGGPPRLPYCPPTREVRAEIEAAFRDLRG